MPLTYTNIPFELKSKKQAIILMGLQASGKTSFFQTCMQAGNYCLITLDALRTRTKENDAINQCLQTGQSYVVDNTNPTREDRARYIPIAKEHGYEVIGCFMQSIVKDCIARNERRVDKVPELAIAGTCNKLQIPSYEEGFDTLYFVHIKNNEFIISDWEENK